MHSLQSAGIQELFVQDDVRPFELTHKEGRILAIQPTRGESHHRTGKAGSTEQTSTDLTQTKTAIPRRGTFPTLVELHIEGLRA